MFWYECFNKKSHPLFFSSGPRSVPVGEWETRCETLGEFDQAEDRQVRPWVRRSDHWSQSDHCRRRGTAWYRRREQFYRRTRRRPTPRQRQVGGGKTVAGDGLQSYGEWLLSLSFLGVVSFGRLVYNCRKYTGLFFWTFRKNLKAKKTQAEKNSSKLFKNSTTCQLKTDFLLKKALKLIYFAQKFAQT